MGRFNIVFDMGKPLYAKETKIVIEKAVLTKDNETGKVFAQIKMKNVLSQTLIAVKVTLTGYDVSGEKIEEKEFTYLDLAVNQGREFGQKTPVDFQNSTVRSFNVKITETVYSDGSKLTGTESEYYPVPEPELLSSKLSKAEIEQYEKSNEISSADYIVTEFSDLWICTCGAINTIDSDSCYFCGASRENLKRTLDKDLLDEEIKESIYNKAIVEYRPKNKDCIGRAIEILKTVGSYRDSKELIARYETEIAAIDKKAAEEKAARKKKAAKITGILAGIVALCIAVALLFNFVIMPNKKLGNAEKLINEGEYEEAYAILDELGENKAIAKSKYNRACEMIENGNYKGAYMLLAGLDYKDSGDKMAEIAMTLLKKCNVGDTVEFGDYHGAVEWLVLDKQDGKVLLISKYCLDAKPYNEKYEPVTWETCTLRQWLNGDFINETFSGAEKTLICDTYLQNPDNPKWGADGGSDTTDKVFLLSIDEAEKYFANDEARKAKATDYAKVHEIYVSIVDDGISRWLLRLPGRNSKSATFVYNDGSINDNGSSVNSSDYGVRPAMWVNIEK